MAIFERDLNDRQKLDKLLNNTDLQHGSATGTLLRMRGVIVKGALDQCLVKLRLLSNLPQQVHAVPVSFQNNAVYEPTASDY